MVKDWYKNGNLHKEDGPAYVGTAYVGISSYKVWRLDGKFIWSSNYKHDLRNEILLSKDQHPKYPTVQVWKILDKDKIYEQIMIPGMEEFIKNENNEGIMFI